uniref:Uncharacterized protein n=1 Tax=Sphaerodactylus townsendi TaxID=933632 RepID=A0ACB8EZM5_9SAUR
MNLKNFIINKLVANNYDKEEIGRERVLPQSVPLESLASTNVCSPKSPVIGSLIDEWECFESQAEEIDNLVGAADLQFPAKPYPGMPANYSSMPSDNTLVSSATD